VFVVFNSYLGLDDAKGVVFERHPYAAKVACVSWDRFWYQGLASAPKRCKRRALSIMARLLW
jgi:hypothetical protein